MLVIVFIHVTQRYGQHSIGLLTHRLTHFEDVILAYLYGSWWILE